MMTQRIGKPKQQDLDAAIRECLVAAIRTSKKSREQITDEMSSIFEQRISVRMLNDYTATAESKRAARFPAAWVPAFCEVTGDDLLRRLLLCPRLRKLIEIAEGELETHKARRRKRELCEQLRSGEGARSYRE
jgi:hypothetical protein